MGTATITVTTQDGGKTATSSITVNNTDPAGRDTTSLETLVYGAAPMSAPRLNEAQDAFGPVLMQVYGQTECVGMSTSLRKDEHDPIRRPDLLTSCGRPVLGVHVELLDDEGGPVAADAIGELCVRSRAVMNGYWKRPAETAAALKGGWLRTGDMARRDDGGFFHLVDRKKDMIVTGGFNVFAKEVEDVIATDPAAIQMATGIAGHLGRAATMAAWTGVGTIIPACLRTANSSATRSGSPATKPAR